MNPRPLTDRAKILELMAQGYELGWSRPVMGMRGYARLQLGGIGRGGETIDVHASTFRSMAKNGQIKRAHGREDFTGTVYVKWSP